MKIIEEIISFILPNREGHSVGMALFIAAIAVATALIAPPFLNGAADRYADNRAFGIDTVITGSVEKAKRHTIRKSVLD
jgi:hypothetical protein